MKTYKTIVQELYSLQPSKPVVVDNNITGLTLDWKQHKFENDIIEKYFIYKLQCKSKINGWIHFYSGGKTRKFFENLQPSRQLNFRLKIILKGSYLERCRSKIETNDLSLNGQVHDKNVEHSDDQTTLDSLLISPNSDLDPHNCKEIHKGQENNNLVSSDVSPKWIESLWSEELKIFTESEGPSVLCFCMAVRCGYIKQVQVMLEQRRDLLSICNCNDGFTPFAIAVRKGNLAMVKFLINQGAEVNQISTTTQTPIQLSAYHRHLEVTTLLLEQGADIRIADRNGLSLLHYAVDSNDLNIVQFALTSGCDVSVVDNNGWTPLFRAVIQGAGAAVVQILVENGSNLQHTDKRNFNLATYAKLLKNRDDIRRIVDKNFIHEKAFSNFTKLSKKFSNVHSIVSKSLEE